ncbi:MAG: dienelactone hydrolase family protein [Acidimicrobiales bacterium]
MTERPEPSEVLADFTRSASTFGGKTRDVYRLGTGPAVVIMSEVPGITPKVAEFARRVAGIGCTAVMPHLFGQSGEPPSKEAIARTMIPVCISREFSVLAMRRTSPVIAWLRELARDEHAKCGGPGVGAVGMCLTGGFALAMMVDDEMVAPVLSQPSLPFPVSRRHRADLGISDSDLARVKERVAAGACVLGLRFSDDPFCFADRFDRLRSELGDGFVAVELDSSPGNPYGHPRHAHSVLTEHLDDRPGTPTRAALDTVLAFFADRLLARGRGPAIAPGS